MFCAEMNDGGANKADKRLKQGWLRKIGEVIGVIKVRH